MFSPLQSIHAPFTSQDCCLRPLAFAQARPAPTVRSEPGFAIRRSTGEQASRLASQGCHLSVAFHFRRAPR